MKQSEMKTLVLAAWGQTKVHPKDGSRKTQTSHRHILQLNLVYSLIMNDSTWAFPSIWYWKHNPRAFAWMSSHFFQIFVQPVWKRKTIY